MENHFTTYFYQVSGLFVESEIRLPDLIETRTAANVSFRYGKITASRVKNLLKDARRFERPGCRIQASAAAMLIEWEKVGKFLIRGGTQIIVDPEAGVIEEDLQPFLTGPALSVLLHQRGCLVLHASAVLVNDAAFVFVGAKGDGKSTLAAHLQVRGHRLISDDIVPVNFADERVLTVPGYPRIKLFEDSIAAVGENPEKLPLIHRFVEKRSFQCAENFSTEPLVLRGVFALTENDEIFLERLNPAAAFIEVTKNTYLNRYLEALNCLPEHFRQCRELIQNLPVLKLNRPHRFEVMHEVCTLLEDYAGELVGARELRRAV